MIDIFFHEDGRLSRLSVVIVVTGIMFVITWLVGLLGGILFGYLIDANLYIFTAVPFTGGAIARAWQMVAESKKPDAAKKATPVAQTKAAPATTSKAAQNPKPATAAKPEPAPAPAPEPVPFPLTIESLRASDGTPVPNHLVPNALRLLENVEIIWREVGCGEIIIGSAYRTKEINDRTKDAKPYSRHLLAEALDFKIKGVPQETLYNTIKRLAKDGRIVKGYVYKFLASVHYDVRLK
jgi:hypothetical protein